MADFHLIEENFEFSNRENYKSRHKKCKKLPTSQTCTKTSRKNLSHYNREAVLTEKYSSLPKNIEKIFIEKNLLQSHSYKNSSKEDVMIRNQSSQNVAYSMNKKNRWLLPEIIRSYTEEYSFKKDLKGEKEDEEANNFGITAYFIDKKTSRRTRLEPFEYFDNNEIHLTNSFNYNSLYAQINNQPRRHLTRSGERENNRKIRQIKSERILYRKEKPHSKNTNHKLNSWFEDPIIPREIDDNERTQRFRDANKIQFNFLMPRKIIRHSKCCEIGSRYGMLTYDKDYSRYSWNRIREYRRNIKDKKSFSLFDAKKESKELVPSLNSNIESIYDSNPILTSFEEILLFSQVKAWPLASTIMPKKVVNNYFNEIPSRKIIQIDESDALCFFNGLKKNKVSNLEDSQITSGISDVQIKPNGIFKKYQFQVNDKIEFLNSLKNDAQITLDTTPVQQIINLDNEYSSSYAIINLSTLDSFYLNTNLSDYAKLDEICQESQSKLFCNADDFKSFLSQSLTEKVVSAKSQDKKLTSNLIGKYSFTDEQTLNKCYSIKLNPTLTETKDVKKFFINSQITGRKLCQVCYDELDEIDFLKLNKCEHEACTQCWMQFFRTQIENMKVTVSFNKEKSLNTNKICCLHAKCDTIVRLDTIRALLPIDFANKYVQFYTDLQIIQSNSNLVYCKDKKCNKLIQVVKDDENMVSVCECGQMICNYCFKENHFPSMCIQAREYFKNIEKLNEIMVEDPTELATSEGKRCPSCDNYMEKNMGCNHMSCPCGFQFCWLCLKDFYQYHSAQQGYACNNTPVEVLKYDSSYFVSIKNVRTKFSAIMRESRQRKTSIKLQQKTNDNLKSLATFCKSELSKEIRIILSDPSSFNHKEDVNVFLEKNGLKTKFKDFTQENLAFDIELDEIIENVKSNFYNFNLVIEYLALLLSRRSKKFFISNYSFGTNLYKSLKKAILVYSLQNEIFCENGKGLERLRRILFYDKIIRDFVSNLKHLTMNCLKIYDSLNFDKNVN